MRRLFLILVLLIFIAGCQQGTGISKINGVNIIFPNDKRPPLSVLEDSGFSVEVELNNYADTDVDVQVCIRDDVSDQFGGIEENGPCDYFKLPSSEIEKNKVVPVEGESISFPLGGGLYSYYGFKKDLTGKNIIVEVVYHIESTIESNFCVKATSTEGKCKDSEDLTGNEILGRTLPLTVTNIAKDIYPGEGPDDVLLQITLTLEKLKDTQDTTNKIFYDPDLAEKEGEQGINIREVTYGDYILDCTDVKDEKLIWKDLNKNPQTLVCNKNFHIGEVEPGYTLLSVNLDYYFKTKKSKSINIKTKESLGFGEEGGE